MIEDVDIHIGERISKRRRTLGLTQENIGVACGVGFQQIHKYERAANRVPAAMLWKLAEALDVGVEFFFDGLAPPRLSSLASDLEPRPR